MNITTQSKGALIGLIAVVVLVSLIFLWPRFSAPSTDPSTPDANGNYVPESAALYDPSTLADEDIQMVSEGDAVQIEGITLQILDIQERANSTGEIALSARVLLPDGAEKIVFEDDQFLVQGVMFFLRALEEGAGDVPGLATIGVLQPTVQ